MRPFATAVQATLAIVTILVVPSLGAQTPQRARSVAVAPFQQLAVTGIASVTLVQGDREDVSVDAPAGTHAKIRVDSEGGVLSIDVQDERTGWKIFGGSGTPPRITVSFRTLDSLRIAGAVKVESARIVAPSLRIEASGATHLHVDALDTRSLRMEGSGAVKSELAGRATEQRVQLSGAAEYRAGDLASDAATVEVSGAARVIIRAAKTLDLHVSGAGSVDYLGNPKVTQEVSGAARVRQR